MTYRFYKRFLSIFFIIFIPIFLLNQFPELIKKGGHPIFWFIIFFAYPCLSIMLLYFGIYAHLCGVKTLQKIDGPITLIVGGGIFTLLSFGPPALSYFLTYDTKIEPVSSTMLQTIRENAIDKSKKPKERLSSAKYYYIKTGQTIEYLNENDKKTFYAPINSAKNERLNHIQNIQEVENITSMIKTTVIALIGIAVVSSLSFLVLLWRKSKGGTEKLGTAS